MCVPLFLNGRYARISFITVGFNEARPGRPNDRQSLYLVAFKAKRPLHPNFARNFLACLSWLDGINARLGPTTQHQRHVCTVHVRVANLLESF